MESDAGLGFRVVIIIGFVNYSRFFYKNSSILSYSNCMLYGI